MSEEKERPFSDGEYLEHMTDEFAENARIQGLQEETRKDQIEINHKRTKIQKTEMDRISNIQDRISGEDILKRPFKTDGMQKSVDDRKHAVVFFNEDISDHFVIAPGSLVVIPSMTNNGKSTIVASLISALVEDKKKVMLLSNEETEEDARARVSCLRTNVSFGDYKTNKCTQEELNIVFKDAEYLANSGLLIVISSKDEADAYRVTTVNGVIQTMKSVNGKIDCVMLDYYNNVNMSEFGHIDPWHINNQLASELNILKGNLSYPIIAMAQCEAVRTEKKYENKGQIDYEGNHVSYRWKGGKNLITYATDIIELIKDFDNSCSFLYAHKVRFGHGKLRRQHTLPFDKKMQRFVPWSAEWDAESTSSKTVQETKEQSQALRMGDVFKEK